jgi:hypothetical protein
MLAAMSPDPITEIRHGYHFLKDGGVGGVLGLLVGLYMTLPRGCGNALSGATECENRIHQHFQAINGTPISLEWIGPLVAFIAAGALAGWLLGNLFRTTAGSD